jgi:hypothetical protein
LVSTPHKIANMDYSDSLKTLLNRINDFLDYADWLDQENVCIPVKDIPEDVMVEFCLKVEKAINCPKADFDISVEFCAPNHLCPDDHICIIINSLINYPNMNIAWDDLH